MSGASRHKGAVLVVGAAGTLGQATCAVLAEQGATVYAADAKDCAGVLAELGDGHQAWQVDVTDERSVEVLVEQVFAAGPCSGVVYAAGANYTGPVATTSWPDYERVMSVNLRGAFHIGKALSSHLSKSPGPLALAFLSSVAGLKGEYGGSVYCASKFGLIGFVQSLASEIAAYGCRANAVCPGNVDSTMLRELAEQIAERSGDTADQVLAQWADTIAFRRLIQPVEVARTCAWLVSCESSGISGQSIVVDGPPLGV